MPRQRSIADEPGASLPLASSASSSANLCFQAFGARRRCDQSVVDIGKVRARPREKSIAVNGNFLPMRFKTCLAGE